MVRPPGYAPRQRPRSGGGVLLAIAVIIAMTGCARGTVASRYRPRRRAITVTTVPLLVKETAKLYPFLARDFAPGGVLDGKEVYAFEPNAITVVAGDTIEFTFINPEDDVHNFVLGSFAVSLPPQDTAHAVYVARTPGIFRFECAIPAHLPMMAGQLVVLAPAAVATATAGTPPDTDAVR